MRRPLRRPAPVFSGRPWPSAVWRAAPFKVKAGLALALAFFALAGGDRLLSGRVIEVTDGDSLTLYSALGQSERVRLYGIDSPEAGQAGGREAARFCRALALRKQVEMRTLYEDQYGRKTAVLTLPDGAILNEEMVRAGHAWVYPQFCKEARCRDWKRLEKEAREKKLGLWDEPDPVPPWKWRKGRRQRD